MTLCSFPMPLSSLSTMIAFSFFLLIPSATPLKFDFGNISDHQRKIILANDDSHFSSQGLQLTPDDVSLNREQRAGRATYIKPLHLWDSGSGELADFTTSFSFVISLSGSSYYADGLTFFLAENTSVITPGGCLGLPVDPATNVPVARFVAVEFDTYGDNVWDPPNTGDHVGIDINSLHSAAYEKWSSSIYLGLEYEATISYKAASKDLSVVFTGYQDTTKVQQDALHYTVDLFEFVETKWDFPFFFLIEPPSGFHESTHLPLKSGNSFSQFPNRLQNRIFTTTTAAAAAAATTGGESIGPPSLQKNRTLYSCSVDSKSRNQE